MRVAIIGAGPAGLSCAIALEREGVDTVVFEQADRPGETFTHMGLSIPVMERPLGPMITALKKEYQVSVSPVRPVERFVMHGPGVTSQVTGKSLGLVWHKGRYGQSVTGQLLALFHGPVLFSTRADYLELRRTYDYVVVATGDREIPAMLGLWQDWFRSWVVGAQVLGEFDPAASHIWFDTRTDKHGYAYLVPFNERLATLHLVVKGVQRKAAWQYWRAFLEKKGVPTGPTVCSYDCEHVTGWAYPSRLGNTFFAGIAGGFMDAFLGFGLTAAWITGMLAARAIARGGSYQEALQPVRRLMLDMLSLRRAFDRLDNAGIDRVTAAVGLPGLRGIIYHTPLDTTHLTAAALGLLRGWRAAVNPAPAFGPDGR